MREIKFRAWDTKSESMEYEIAIGKGYGEDSYILFLGLGETFIIDDDIVKIMQYTGLKDKNNVEIFEGDIVGHNSFIGYVKYINSGNCNVLGYALVSLINGRIFYMFCDETDNYEVIGNIHENQELLN